MKFITILFALIFHFQILANGITLEKTVHTLSSKEYEGRRPGTPGNIKATEFLVDHIKK